MVLSKYYGEKEFALGYPTLVDFQFSEISHHFEKIYPEEFAKHSCLKRCRDAFNALPEIKKYYEQEGSIKGPFTAPFAALHF